MQVERIDDWFESFCNSDPKDHPYVVDDGQTRKLHFDSICVQSAMRLNDPFALVFGYTQVMMAFLLLVPRPSNILVVGLGGGSLSKYCYQELPDCTVTTIEISAAVIKLRENFAIPPDNSKFKVVHADASQFMQAQYETADVVLLDGYDPTGIPVELSSQQFYDACFRALRPGGVLAANLWGSEGGCEVCFDRIQKSFARCALITPSDSDDNRVAFGFKQIDASPWVELESRARYWELRTGIRFTDILGQWRAREDYAGIADWLVR